MKEFRFTIFIKVLLCLAVLLLSLASCDCSTYRARQNVEAEFPNGIIYNVPNMNYRFIVIDSVGSIWYVGCLNLTNDNITRKMLIHNVR